MALTTNTKTYSSGVVNHAVGRVVTDAGAAANTTFTVGFIPRIVRFHNLTDRVSTEWFEGMAAYEALLTAAAGSRTLETTNGISVGTDGTFTVKAATIIASKVFNWEAIG